MHELLTSTNPLAFIAGLTLGLLVGIMMGIYVGYHFRNKQAPIVLASLFGGLMAVLWAGLHTFAIISGSFTIPFTFDIVGGIAMGQTLGIDLVQAITKIKK